MSVGHVQRALETAGVATVGVYVQSFAHIPRFMGISRALITQHPMGRPLGAPGDYERQAAVVAAAIDLATASEQTITTFPEPYRIPRPSPSQPRVTTQ
ncbi:MAG: hypothetical protein V3V01_12615 [Acidimicrobiales bacterium]